MGGWGSGKRWSCRDTTDEYLQLDVKKLSATWLALGVRSTLRWSRRGVEIASIGLKCEGDRLILRYQDGKRSGNPTNHEYPVCLERTPCNYGGERLWFRCPARGCGRRVRILYGGEIFACRQCHNLAYESQKESEEDRATRRAWALIDRVGGLDFGTLFDPLPPKPKGMRDRTYQRLEWHYAHFQAKSFGAISRRLGISLEDG